MGSTFGGLVRDHQSPFRSCVYAVVNGGKDPPLENLRGGIDSGRCRIAPIIPLMHLRCKESCRVRVPHGQAGRRDPRGALRHHDHGQRHAGRGRRGGPHRPPHRTRAGGRCHRNLRVPVVLPRPSPGHLASG